MRVQYNNVRKIPLKPAGRDYLQATSPVKEHKTDLSAIHHIAIIVSDYPVSKDFYVNKLGFSVIRENYRQDKKDWKLDLRLNFDTELEIFAPENPPKRPSYPEACGLRHLAFQTENIELAVKELAEKGITCEPIRTDTFTGKRSVTAWIE